MTSRYSGMIVLASLLASLLALAGCDGGRDRPPPTQVEVIHAAPGQDTLLFLRVESLVANLNYRGHAAQIFDEDTYRFSVETLPPGAADTDRVITFEQAVMSDTDYAFIMTEINDLLDVLVVERPAHPENATSSSGLIVHAGPDLPPMAVYVVPPDTDLNSATPMGVVGFTEVTQPAQLAAGTYELFLTAVDDPTDIALHSPAFSVSNQDSNLFVILSEAGQGISELSVLRLHAQAQFLHDRGTPSVMRLINATADRAPRDVYLGEPLDTPLISGAEFGTPTEYVPTTIGPLDLTITAQGNVGAIELEYGPSAVAGRMHTMLMVGEPGSLSAAFATDDRRRLGDRGRVRFADGTNQFGEDLEVFFVPAGTATDSLGQAVPMSSPGFSTVNGYAPGDYELYARFGGSEGSFVAGPLAVTIEAGELYNFFLLDGETSNDATILQLN